MNHDQRMEAARACVVDGAGYQFFSRAALAGYQDRGVGGRDGLNRVKNLLHGLALADDFLGASDFGDGLPKAHVFLFGMFVSERFFYKVSDFVGIEWLGDVVIGAI